MTVNSDLFNFGKKLNSGMQGRKAAPECCCMSPRGVLNAERSF